MYDRMDWYDKYAEKQEEAFLLKLLLIEVKHDLELQKQGFRQVDDIIEKINKTLKP